jgi:hypothetical protein
MTNRLKDVFTPTLPARLTFINRDKIQKNLESAIQLPGKQVVIYGPSGAGKTTLLKNTMEELGVSYISTSCKNNMSLEQLNCELLRKLDVKIMESEESVSGGEIGGEISGGFMGIGAKVSSKSNDQVKAVYKKIDTTEISINTIIDELGQRKLCWVIEDFHKIKENQKVDFSQTMKMFMDAADDYSDIKIIAIGAVNTAREVVNYDIELNNRVAEIPVPLLLDKELEEIISKGSTLLNVYFKPKTTEKIVTYSNGLPSVTHQLCYASCSELSVYKTFSKGGTKEITQAALDEAILVYIEEKSDSYMQTYDLATKVIKSRKFDNPIDILTAILELRKNQGVTVPEIKIQIQKRYHTYKGSNLKKYVTELSTSKRGNILRYDKDSDKFCFHNPFIQAYSYCLKDRNGDTDLLYDKTKLIKKLEKTLREELLNAKQQFLQDFDPEFGVDLTE